MYNYTFEQNVSLNLLPRAGEINFCYHINTFDWQIEHTHVDYWEFTIITNGTIANCVNGTEKIYKAGTVIPVTTADCHYLKALNGEPVRYITILVKEAFILELFRALDLSTEIFGDDERRLSLSDAKIAEIEGILGNIDDSETQKYKEHDKLACSVLLILLSAFLSTENVERLEIASWQKTLASLSQSEKLLTCDVNTLCRELGYSRTQLNALFKQTFCMTPHDYLINDRLMHAKNLLLNTNLSIADIAGKTGFSGTMRFYVNFKRVFGMTPSAFRKRTQGQ